MGYRVYINGKAVFPSPGELGGKPYATREEAVQNAQYYKEGGGKGRIAIVKVKGTGAYRKDYYRQFGSKKQKSIFDNLF